MLSSKNFRPIFFVVAIAAFMILATTSVEAVPAELAGKLPCVDCSDPPPCRIKCPRGYYCDYNPCTCKAQCFMGEP
ncbi:hypothetical protein BGX29_007139 [Mortierella sp. GBA35]|nr:hypothetical protein BGX29_007139 [Mortierella sp. GBA35]